MDRKGCVVGFLGMEQYEYIMYLSRVLHHMGKKVLMIDCSETGALKYGVSRPLSIENSMIESRGVNFYGGTHMKEIDLPKFLATDHDYEFDYILIDFGSQTNSKGLKRCEHLVYVTDQQTHNIQRISNLDQLKDINKSLILKNMVSCKITPNYIIKELSLDNVLVNQVYVIDADEMDAICKINCQYDGVYRFTKLSTQSKGVVRGLIRMFLPELTNKEWRLAYQKAEKGVSHS